jgi:hypothetical protein
MVLSISIGVATSRNRVDRFSTTKNTWGKDFDHFYMFGGNATQDSDPLIKIEQAEEDWGSFFLKQHLGLKYMFERNPDDDWYCFVGDDHILFKKNIENFLKNYNPKQHFLICQTYNRFLSINNFEFEVFAGGAAFFISNTLKKKINKITDNFNEEWLNLYHNGLLPESCYACGDISMSYLVKKYFDVNLTHCDRMFSQNPSFYQNIQNPLSFHYISAHEMQSIYDKYSYL